MKKAKKNEQLDAEEIWKVAWTYIKTVVDTVREPFLILDKNLRVISANKIFYSFFITTKAETEKKLIYRLGDRQWNIAKLKILLEDILPKNTHFTDFKVEHNFPKVGRKIMLLNARRIYTTVNEKPIILLAMEDITKQIRLEEQLREYSKKLHHEVAERTSELELRVRELERVNKTMVKRELRMIELKKEIFKLRKSLKK